jgi:8-oxo-dGTP diphosphatase
MRVIIAAGGLISRQTAHGPEIAVILRHRYGSEWCLPKGKVREGESWEETALREVKEETGCVAHITGFVGPTHYRYNDTEKVVFYWKMEVKDQCSFQPSEEVEKLEWLPPFEALNRLTHDDERNVVRMAYNELKISHHYPFYRSIKWIWFRCFGSSEYIRIAGTLSAYSVELEHRINEALKKEESNMTWANAARKLLQKAELALARQSIDEGWKCLQAAHRMEILGYGKEELEQEAMLLRQEAEKLKSWRKKATYDLIGRPDSLIGKIQIGIDEKRVYRASLLRDEHFNNQYHKISIRRRNLSVLFLIIILTILALPISAAAMAAYVFLEAGFLDTGSTLKSVPAILAIAFIAGFSERLVVKAIDTTSGK